MEKEDFLKSVFDSTKRIEKAEPPPFLFEKINARINSGEGKPVSGNWIFAAAASVLLILNIVCLSTVSTNNVQETPSQDGYEIVQQITYNY